MTLTPEANAEVRRNTVIVLGSLAAGILAFVTLLAVVINPPGSTAGYRLASTLLVAFLLPLSLMTAVCYILAYPMGGWPAFMRTCRLGEIYGFDASELSNAAMRRWMKRPAYWALFAKGSAVGLIFAAPWFVITWAMSRPRFPEGYAFPTIWMVFYSGALAAKAWVIKGLMKP